MTSKNGMNDIAVALQKMANIGAFHVVRLSQKYISKSQVAQGIFLWIFVARRKTCLVKIVSRKNDILSEIITNCSSKMINN